MGLIFLIALGLGLGSVVAIITRTGDKPGLLVNLLAGVTGALLTAVFINPLIGLGNILRGEYEVHALLLPLCGSLLLTAALSLLRHTEMR
jgi:uncharacterized membrane protein YeaQ/YmgE (transglycosylase-associated protein family)